MADANPTEDMSASGGGRAAAEALRSQIAEETSTSMIPRAPAPRMPQYQVLAHTECAELGERLAAINPTRFTFHPTKWAKFPDGTDDIVLGGFEGGRNLLAGERVLFLASFHSNDATLAQFHALVALQAHYMVGSLTVLLPFYPVATMERVVREGEVATAATTATLFSNLPRSSTPMRLMMYDLHTLQNRFYFINSAIASLHTTIPLVLPELAENNITCVAFPDDGAAKRFKHLFLGASAKAILGDHVEIVVCAKVRDGDKRVVRVTDGEPKDLDVVIVDDLVQTGGTLHECGAALRTLGARSVSAYVAHGVFPNDAWKRFCRGDGDKSPRGDRAVFTNFWVTNSIPTTTRNLPTDDVFHVLDLAPKIIEDLDHP